MINYLKLFLILCLILGQMEVEACTESCNESFGVLVGQSFLTKAYSNCNGSCVSEENNEINVPGLEKPVFTGMKWQCVEYARRWWIENKNLSFVEVQYAYHIWDLSFAQQVKTQEKLPLLHFKNKQTKEAPKIGDLLIYSSKQSLTGHVAVVVGLEADSVLIAEQNYFNRSWEGKNYARRLLLDKNAKGQYRIFDDSLIGWVRVSV